MNLHSRPTRSRGRCRNFQAKSESWPYWNHGHGVTEASEETLKSSYR